MNKILLALILAGSAQAAEMKTSPQEYFSGHEYLLTIDGKKKAVQVYRRVGTYGQLYEVEVERECVHPVRVCGARKLLLGLYFYGRQRGGVLTELYDFTKADPVEFNIDKPRPPKGFDPEQTPRRIWQNRMEIDDMEKAEK